MKKTAFAFPFLLVACTINSGEVENHIKSEFKAKGVELKSVSCPAGIKAKAGDKFDCKGEDAHGTAFVVNVTQKDGGVEWKLQGKIFEASAITSTLKEKGVEGADCGPGSYVAVKGAKLDCKAGGQALAIKFSDDDGNWNLDGAPAGEKKDEKKADEKAEEKKEEKKEE